MATIRKRKNSDVSTSYEAQVRRKGSSTQTKSFPRRAEAETWAAELERQMRLGAFAGSVAADSYTLTEELKRYEKERGAKRPGGLAALYKQQIGYWKKHELAERALGKITPTDLRRASPVCAQTGDAVPFLIRQMTVS